MAKQMKQLDPIIGAGTYSSSDRADDDVICKYEKKTVTIESLAYAINPKEADKNELIIADHNKETENESKLKILYKKYRLLVYFTIFVGLAFFFKDILFQIILSLTVLSIIALVLFKAVILIMKFGKFIIGACLAVFSFVIALSLTGWILSLFI